MDQIPGRFPPPPAPDWRSSRQAALYPLDLNRLMELTFSLFRFRWRMFVGIALIVMLPAWGVVAAGDLLVGDTVNWFSEISDIARTGSVDVALAGLWGPLAIDLAVGAVAGIGIHVASGAVTTAAAALYTGERPAAGTAIRGSLARLPTFISLWLVVFLAELAIVAAGVFVGTALFLATSSGGQIVPGPTVFLGMIVLVATFAAIIFITTRWTLAIPVMMLESTGALAALRRSWQLVTGSSWRVLGYVLLFAILLGLIAGLLSAVITLIVNPIRMVGVTVVSIDPTRLAISTFFSGVISSALMPISVIGMMLLYYDLRFRRGEKVPVPGEAPQANVTEALDPPKSESGSVSE